MWKIIVFWLVTVSYFTTSTSQACVVTDGKSKGSDCVFPFKFEGSEYNGCILETNQAQFTFEVQYWCSTEVDTFGNHVKGKGSWGHCSSECPLAETGDSKEEDYEDDYEDEESIPCNLSNGGQGYCQPFGICTESIFDQEESSECSAGDDSALVCCPEKTTDNVNLSALRKVFGNAEDNISKLLTIPVDTEKSINAKLNNILRKRKDNERRQVSAGNIIQRIDAGNSEINSADLAPVRSHRLFNRPRKGAFKIHEVANDLRDVADDANDLTNVGLRSLDINSRTVSLVNETCPWTGEGAPDCSSDFHKKYRKSNGECNSLKNPNFGRTETPFQRILPSAYSANVRGNFKYSMPRTSNIGGSRMVELPSARLLSTSMSTNQNPTSREGQDTLHTTMVMQMGQFIDHDITHSPTFQFDDPNKFCCTGGRFFPETYDPKDCYPIRIPENDSFWKGNRTCMEFTRSLTAPNLDCSFGFKDQMNQITHWLDNSNIYGSDDHETRNLRELKFGRLKTSNAPGKRSNPQDLPKCSKNFKTKKPGMCEGCPNCYAAGDERANEQLNLLAFHTIWMREHNRVAKALSRLNSNWDDETLFQEARRIVTAEYQHIVYNEWLPLVVGKTYMDDFHLWPLSKGYSKVYLDTFDPRVTNEFAAAAFRFGHSLIPHSFQSGRKTGNQQTPQLTLREIFFKPEEFHKSGLLEDLTEGLTAQNGEEWDNRFVPDITNHLFGDGSGGMDLVALNIQRGRDHGLPGYNEYREICQVTNGKATKFEDFEDFIDSSHVKELKRAYNHVDDVDLFVGGFLERRHGDSPLKVGPTFKCIIGDTFARLKMGDRFFYDLNGPGTKRFTPRQLRNIRKTSMARILCDNTDMTEVQPQAFRMKDASKFNLRRPCNDFRNIPLVDFGGFRERDPILSDFTPKQFGR